MRGATFNPGDIFDSRDVEARIDYLEDETGRRGAGVERKDY